jgi:hypothetical protein
MQMKILEKIGVKAEKKANDEFMYTEEQLMARLKFFIGVCLTLTLTGIVFVVLYSIIFVTQPLNAISPIDQKFFEMLVPISTFLTGILSGIMLAGNDKDLQAKAIDAATGVNQPPRPPGLPPMSAPGLPPRPGMGPGLPPPPVMPSMPPPPPPPPGAAPPPPPPPPVF